MTALAPRDTTFRRDIASAYLASASRIGSWVVVSALVYRSLGADEFGVLALIRGTLGVLNYVTVGLAPALIHRAAAADRPRTVLSAPERSDIDVLSYAAPPEPDISLASLYRNALAIAYMAGVAGAIGTVTYALLFSRIYPVSGMAAGEDERLAVIWFGFGIMIRLMSDAPGAVLQVRSRIAMDNAFVAAGDFAWAALVAIVIHFRHSEALTRIAALYLASGFIPLVGRQRAGARITGVRQLRMEQVSWPVMQLLLSYGSLVVLAQLADYLYAPTDYILIGRLLFPKDLASYAPAVQIDAGLLLLVTGLSAVLLPKTAVAHAAGSRETVRRYYVRGTTASLAMLAAASAIIWLISPWLFRLWLGNPMPATQAILPLVLLNTVLGGSSAVGRSILLAVGKARPFTIAAITSGTINVACSYVFVRYFGLGLRGIVLGTIVAVVGRCVIWMPWYVFRAIRTGGPVEAAVPGTVLPER